MEELLRDFAEHGSGDPWDKCTSSMRAVGIFDAGRFESDGLHPSHACWSGPAGQEGFNAGVYADSVLPVIEAKQAMIVDSDAAIGDGLLLHPTPGHSPGHVAVRLQSEGAEGVFSADVMHQPLQVYRPDWNDCFCTDPAAALLSRRWLLEHAAERGTTVFTGHFARSSAGYISRQGDLFNWKFA